MRAVAVFAVLALLIGGCAGALVVPNAADVGVVRARYPDATLLDLEKGRALYVARCAGCHALHLPRERTPAQWPGVVDEMAPDAHISDADKQLIQRYLVGASARPR